MKAESGGEPNKRMRATRDTLLVIKLNRAGGRVMRGVGLLRIEWKVLVMKDEKTTHKAYPENAPGPFYSEEDGCLACGAPHVEAPELMSWYIDPSGTNEFSHCFFRRQPETPEEVQHAINAMHSSCVENLRYAGRDPAILETLCRMGYRHLCDSLEQSV